MFHKHVEGAKLGYQVSVLQAEWVNKSGTYGVASAQTYWPVLGTLSKAAVHSFSNGALGLRLRGRRNCNLQHRVPGSVGAAVVIFQYTVGAPIAWHTNLFMTGSSGWGPHVRNRRQAAAPHAHTEHMPGNDIVF